VVTGAALGEISPFAPHFFTRDRWRLHYVDEGRGDPVVMLHGNPSWSFYYRRLVEALRPRHRVIVPDHIGCGLSEKPGITEYPYTLESRVDDLEALLDQLAVDGELTLVLHDWGGMIGMAYASRHPGRIRRLIVLNTAAFHLPPGKPLPWQLRLCRSPLGPFLVRGLNAFCLGAVLLGTTRRPLPAPVRRAYLAPYDSWKNRAAVQRFVEDIPLRPGETGYDLVTAVQEGLERFRELPVLICWGERDFVFDGRFLDEWKRRFPAAEVHTFSDCGHYVLEDAPEEIIALVHRFIGDRSAAAGPPVNIASHLPEMASRQPETLAVAFPAGRDRNGNVSYREYSFHRLEEESNRIGRGLARIGIGRGTRTALMVPPSLEFFALTFALFKAGAVPVLIDPGIGVRNLKQCLAEAEPEAFIGIRKAHLARILLGWGRSTIRVCVTVGERGPWGGFTLEQIRDSDPSSLLTPTGAGETAAILFTSGSTGPPKGAVYTHATFAAQVDLLRRTYGIEPGEIDLPTFPLFALFAPALGMSAVIPDMDATRPGSVDPVNIVTPIERFGVTQMFGSPALIDRVGRYLEEKEIHLPTLRRVISAGAPVPARVLERFARHLPAGVEIFTAYGATEALPVSSIGSSAILAETRAATDAGAGVCIGRPVEGMPRSARSPSPGRW
jgi:pimeloyl-ACP methyl ester carboxylesterase